MAYDDPAGQDLEALATGWLTLPDLADQIGEPLTKVRDWIRERRLVVVERGTPPVKCVPAEFVHDGELIKGLFGALTVLADAGYAPDEALRWLLTDEPALPGRPVDLMAEGRHHAVKRRAMTLAF
ncbi:MAG TPA: Rv2175c family DNA-binding protein [Mycobacteriales bacterium]|nr:Rv2175c family DNA-binding protein [Mycobacteriales bacterium]